MIFKITTYLCVSLSKYNFGMHHQPFQTIRQHKQKMVAGHVISEGSHGALILHFAFCSARKAKQASAQRCICQCYYPSVRPSVRPSVTLEYCVKTRERRGMRPSPSRSPVEYETTPWLSIGDHDLWPWMTLNSPSSRSLKLHVWREIFHNGDRYDNWVNRSRIEYNPYRLSIGSMTFDLGWPWAVLVQCH